MSLGLMIVTASVQAESAGYAYFPPFDPEQHHRVLITQGFGSDEFNSGVRTHNDAVNYYAVDLLLKQGDAVCAAWSGEVIQVFNGEGLGWFEGNKHSNYVRILHDTQQIGDYQHLLSGSINVQIGERVDIGQCFAKVGVSGKTNGAHLHFALLERRSDGRLVSVPFWFVDADGRVKKPTYLHWVYH